MLSVADPEFLDGGGTDTVRGSANPRHNECDIFAYQNN